MIPRRAPALLGLSILLPLSALLVGCRSGDAPRDAGVTRDTLPDGTVVVRYDTLPMGEVAVIAPDLRIGAVEDDPARNFADIRGIDAGSDGTIYVLDYQLSEVRAFDAEGGYLRTIATPGEGPAEISEANGMVLVGDSILWIQDHGKWAMLGVTTAGEEVGRYQMPVRSYGYMWNGVIDEAGRVWKPDSRYDAQPTFPPELGFSETPFHSYWTSYDPGSGVRDSVYLGDGVYRGHVSRTGGGGWAHRGIPFTPELVTAVDPAGGFWLADNSAYRVARLDPRGDTTLVIESHVAALPVTDADRSAYIDMVLEYDGDARATAEEIVSAMPEAKPVIRRFVVDDRGRLWVERVVPEGETPLYDLFERGGDYLGSLRLAFDPGEYLPIRIRDGRLYALVQDELDIPFVVRARIPDLVEMTESAGRE